MKGFLKSRKVGIIQARTGSTRLPNKVIKDIFGKSMLERVILRVRQSSLLDDLVIATTQEPQDDVIVAECRKMRVNFFRGSEEDVLDRYYQAARYVDAGIVVRFTSDCPLLDSGVIDFVISEFLQKKPDYASNTLVRTYPRGLDTEVMTLEALERAAKEAVEFHERSHVTPYIQNHPELFRSLPVTGDSDLSFHRWTVDTPEDLGFIREIYGHFPGRDIFSWKEILDTLQANPELLEINRHVRQKAVKEG